MTAIEIDERERRRKRRDEMLADGERLHVALLAMDGLTDLQRSVRSVAHDDAGGDRFALHRPGPRSCADQSAIDALAEAYASRDAEMRAAWKSDWQRQADTLASERACAFARDSVGDGGAALDEVQQAYEFRDHYLANTWKSPPKQAADREHTEAAAERALRDVTERTK